MFEKAEDEYNDLMSKKNIIEVGLTFSSDNLGLTLKAAYVNLLFSSAEWQVKNQDSDRRVGWEEERDLESHMA